MAAPCDAADSHCLIRTSLRLTYELEACNLKNDHLTKSNDALKKVVTAQEPPARIPAGAFFIGGFIIGAGMAVLTFLAVSKN